MPVHARAGHVYAGALRGRVLGRAVLTGCLNCGFEDGAYVGGPMNTAVPIGYTLTGANDGGYSFVSNTNITYAVAREVFAATAR